jgi:hypothetical protein
MDTIQDTVGRIAIARENVTMAQKVVAQILHVFYERDDIDRGRTPRSPGITPAVVIRGDLDYAIERLELAIHDLKVVKERIQDD